MHTLLGMRRNQRRSSFLAHGVAANMALQSMGAAWLIRGGEGRGPEKGVVSAAEWLGTLALGINRYSIRERGPSAPYNLMIKESSTILASFEHATSEVTG